MKDSEPTPLHAAFLGRVSPPRQVAFRPAIGPDPAHQERNDRHGCR
jgi:hypothetical protein